MRFGMDMHVIKVEPFDLLWALLAMLSSTKPRQTPSYPVYPYFPCLVSFTAHINYIIPRRFIIKYAPVLQRAVGDALKEKRDKVSFITFKCVK